MRQKQGEALYGSKKAAASWLLNITKPVSNLRPSRDENARGTFHGNKKP